MVYELIPMHKEGSAPLYDCHEAIAALQLSLSEFSALSSTFGVSVKPFSEAGLFRLSKMNLSQLSSIREAFDSYLKICSQAHTQKVDLKNSVSFAQAALRSLKLSAPESFFNTVASDDVVEIYDLSHRQIFRNLRFYELTQYSL